MYTDSTGNWCGFDDLAAIIVGALTNVTATFIGDLLTSATTGQWQFSSWQTYVESAVGGAIGGLVSIYAGPIAGAFATGFTSALVGQGLASVTGYNDNSIGDILFNSVVSGGLSIVSRKIMGNFNINNPSNMIGITAINSLMNKTVKTMFVITDRTVEYYTGKHLNLHYILYEECLNEKNISTIKESHS